MDTGFDKYNFYEKKTKQQKQKDGIMAFKIFPANKKSTVYDKQKESLLAREILVLVLFAVLISVSVLFLTPIVSKNIFYINVPSNGGILKFSSDDGTEKIIDKTTLSKSNDKNKDNKNEITGTDMIGKIIKGRNFMEIFLSPSAEADLGNYLKINLKAKNNDSVDFPKGSLNIKWKYEDENNYNSLNQESLQIYIDGFSHDYVDMLGENTSWKPDKKISSLRIEVPDVSGVNITVNELSFNKRSVFPLDSYINKFFKENYDIRQINRFLIPTYIGLLFVFAMIYSLKFISKKVLTGKIAFNAVLVVLFIFSIYFFKNEVLNIKSYFDSYKKNILCGNLKDTYLGFYDFEKFISWAGDKIPECENVIVLIKGEQIYIKSEIVYNLYPRDVKFINISAVSQEKITHEIHNMNLEAAKVKDKNPYKYLIVLSKEDLSDIGKDLKLRFSYKPDAGLIYEIKEASKK